MAEFGDLIFQLMGREDPRKALLAAAAGAGQQDLPAQPGVATPTAASPAAGALAAAGQQPAPAAPAQPPVAKAYQSPPDLANLYMNMLERQRKSDMIDRGIGMIAAGSGFVHPENRAAVLSMGSGGGGGSVGGSDGLDANGTMGVFNTILKMNESMRQKAILLQQRATVPKIAAKYGLDTDTALMLFDSGQLDDFIKKTEEQKRTPDEFTVETLADGTKAPVSKRTGKPGEVFGPAKPDDLEFIGSDASGRIAVNKRTGETVRTLQAPVAPDLKIEKGADGRLLPINPKTGLQAAPAVGPAAPRPTEVVGSDAAGRTLIYKDDGTKISDLNAPIKPDVRTTDQKELDRANEERKAAGQQPISMEDWLKIQNPARATKVNIGSEGALDKSIADEMGKAFVEDYKVASADQDGVANLQNAQTALDRGIVAGSAISPYELSGRKIIGNLFGIDDSKVHNTEEFQSTLQEVVASKLKSYGSGASITDTDREYVLKSIGGSIELNPASIKRILAIQEKAAFGRIISYNDKVDRLNAERAAEGKPRSPAIKIELPQMSPQLKSMFTPSDIEEIKKHPEDKALMAEFDRLYGRNTHRFFVGGN